MVDNLIVKRVQLKDKKCELFEPNKPIEAGYAYA
jgi:hypothetical protein